MRDRWAILADVEGADKALVVAFGLVWMRTRNTKMAESSLVARMRAYA
jgi:hypothetical protein